MTDYIRLNLRSERLAFGGLPACFAGSLLLAAGAGAAITSEPQRAVDAAMLFWTTLGLPLTALLFGGVCGSSLGRARDLEAPLPLSPRARVLGAAASGAIALAVFAVALTAAAWAVSPGWRSAVGASRFVSAVFVPYVRLTGFFSLYLYALSFGFSYVLSNGVAGGLAAAAFAVPAFGASTLALAAHVAYPARVPFWPGFTFAAALALGGAAAATVRAADAVERSRRLGARGWSVCLLLAALGPAVFVLRLPVAMVRLTQGAELARFSAVERSIDPPQRKTPGKLTILRPHHEQAVFLHAPAAQKGGVLLESLTGRLVWLGLDGKRTELLAARPFDLLELLRRPFVDGNDSATWDRQGRIWILRSEAGRHAIWMGRPGAKLERFADVGPRGSLVLALKEGRPSACERGSGETWRCAALETRSPLDFKPVPRLREPLPYYWDYDGGVWDKRGHVARRAEGAVWLVSRDGFLVKIDALTDAEVGRWPIPWRIHPGDVNGRGFVAVEEGVVFRRRFGYGVIDWAGRVRKL